MGELRVAGLTDLKDVRRAYIESTGKISIIPKKGAS
ncbi:DUF421 domain-containing protein [Alcaligenaceae bacterium CGII-47]|nr:DUF421 domain-containing protein [Alcaligenaceae bacterium CGII-47]